jgi:hypothetical protein
MFVRIVRSAFSHAATAAADLHALFDALTAFYQKQQLLSREEFYQIAKRVRRP